MFRNLHNRSARALQRDIQFLIRDQEACGPLQCSPLIPAKFHPVTVRGERFGEFGTRNREIMAELFGQDTTVKNRVKIEHDIQNNE